MTRAEYLALRARLRGEASSTALCRACRQPTCARPDPVYAGIVPAPANRHELSGNTRLFICPTASTIPVNSLYQKGISQ